MSKHTLYVIGNGFDLHHGLHTSVSDWRGLLAEPNCPASIAKALDFLESSVPGWNDLERSLAAVDLDEIAYELLEHPDYSSDHEYVRDDTVRDMEYRLEGFRRIMEEALRTMALRANDTVAENGKRIAAFCRIPKAFLSPGDRVLSFNYTSTLEKLYKIPQGCEIYHIHGLASDTGPLLYGYREPGDSDRSIRATLADPPDDSPDEDKWNYLSDRDFYADSQYQAVLDFYEALKKPSRVDGLQEFLKRSEDISRVIVLGHSMGSVDAPYMEVIEKTLEPDTWFIWRHRDANGNYSMNDKTVADYKFNGRVHFFDSSEFVAGFPVNILYNGHWKKLRRCCRLTALLFCAVKQRRPFLHS